MDAESQNCHFFSPLLMQTPMKHPRSAPFTGCVCGYYFCGLYFWACIHFVGNSTFCSEEDWAQCSSQVFSSHCGWFPAAVVWINACHLATLPNTGLTERYHIWKTSPKPTTQNECWHKINRISPITKPKSSFKKNAVFMRLFLNDDLLVTKHILDGNFSEW